MFFPTCNCFDPAAQGHFTLLGLRLKGLPPHRARHRTVVNPVPSAPMGLESSSTGASGLRLRCRIKRPGPAARRTSGRRRAPDVRARAAAAAVLSGALLGCGGLPETQESKAQAAAVGAQARTYLHELPALEGGHEVLEVEATRPYTGLVLRSRPKAHALPPRFRAGDSVSVPLERALRSAELAQRITAATGLEVRLIGPPRVARAGGKAAEVPFTGRWVGGDALGGQTLWTGALPELLDEWTGELGYEWTYRPTREVIEVTRHESVSFTLHALGGEQIYRAASSTSDRMGGGDEERSVNFSSQLLDTEYRYQPWQDIEHHVGALVSEDTQVNVSETHGTVVVRGLPRDVARVREYLSYLNREVLRPIMVSVHVLNVSRERESDFETDLVGALRTVFGSSYDAEIEIGGTGSGIGIVRPGDAQAGNSLSATLRALRSLGRVSRVLTAGLPSLNGKPAQYYELVRNGYLAEVVTTAGDGAVGTELRPGSVASGFAVSYIGHITGPGEVLLRLFVSLQDRPEFTVIESGGNRIQLPEFASRGINVEQSVREGETLVVAGFSDRVMQNDEGGIGLASNRWLGGSAQHQEVRVEQVLVLTARIGEPRGMSEVREVVL